MLEGPAAMNTHKSDAEWQSYPCPRNYEDLRKTEPVLPIGIAHSQSLLCGSLSSLEHLISLSSVHLPLLFICSFSLSYLVVLFGYNTGVPKKDASTTFSLCRHYFSRPQLPAILMSGTCLYYCIIWSQCLCFSA